MADDTDNRKVIEDIIQRVDALEIGMAEWVAIKDRVRDELDYIDNRRVVIDRRLDALEATVGHADRNVGRLIVAARWNLAVFWAVIAGFAVYVVGA